MPKLDKLKIKKFRNSWFVDIKIEIGKVYEKGSGMKTEEIVRKVLIKLFYTLYVAAVRQTPNSRRERSVLV